MRRSHAGSRPASRHGRSPGALADRRRRYRGRSPAMVAATRTGHWSPTRPRSSGRGARNRASWPRTPQLRGVVADKLDDDWSPQQIAQWLRREFLGDTAMRISHESIYRDLYMPSRKVFDASMFHCLRSGRSIRRPRGKKRSTVAARSATWSPSASDRPRPTPGRWPATGRAISCSERARRRSPPSSTAPPATRWSSRCPTGIRPTRSPAR